MYLPGTYRIILKKIEFLPLDWIYRSIRIMTVFCSKFESICLHPSRWQCFQTTMTSVTTHDVFEIRYDTWITNL